MSKQSYILAYDLGTTGNKAALFNQDCQLVASAFSSYRTYHPFPNAVEQDPEEWWGSIRYTTQKLLQKSKVRPGDIACLTFSGQMMGCVPVSEDATPIGRALIWADQRGTSEADKLETQIGQRRMYEIVGHRPSASYSAAKIMWIRNHEPERFSKTYKFVHAKDFIVARMTGNFVTDYSDASGTNLFDLRGLHWSDEILKAASLGREILPDAIPSTEVAGKLLPLIAAELGLMEGTPVVIGGGDGSCAAAGAGVISEGSAYHYLGSSSWIGIAMKEPIFDEEMRTFNWAHVVPGLISPTGTMQAAGVSYQWMRDVLFDKTLNGSADIKDSYKMMDSLAQSSKPGSRGLLFLPYLMGERSPLWNPSARGCFIGLSVEHTSGDMIRAVMEGVALNLRSIVNVFSSHTDIGDIRLIGGGAKGRIWAQILSSVFNRRILVPKLLDEATSMGAAVTGGVGVGLYRDFEVIRKAIQDDFVLEPILEDRKVYERLHGKFESAYTSLVQTFEDLREFTEQMKS